ncbi:ATP-binding protein [Paraglaciecola chathamensis]|uniref:ATP-binding protein n=1 Tax=Paraglaciecola chathamensis TaxID=368405 RepID=UPI0026F53002|nr:ATP-binding protein [Paraglaciecola chathamensis]MDO6838670.1 ATP-binding protein [Paraglaciecola chathamensis]
MPGLHRIILINCHLPGFVELDVSGHSNICGTNASGKTTLQRLIPVFYGELPSKVVPKTRKKFDEFYLPHANSYLIYEYQREDGQECQVVLTRKGSDGVQYRFIDAPYKSEQILVEMENGEAQAMLPEQWIKQLRQLQIDFSHKIQATSEFRSIIQNDASVGGGGRENTKLRQLAARYSLVSSAHRIRHMEKLVSAVHAKEGKMDTLRTMLAAIFEEDGLVQPTTTVKNTKAREWITQMRQTMRLQSMQGDYEKIQSQTEQLNVIEQQLLMLKPLLEKDLSTLTTEKADGQEQKNSYKAQQRSEKELFEQAEGELNSRISETNEQLSAKSSRLDHLQQQYEKYQDSDIEQLQKDMDALPLTREEYEQTLEHYNLLIEQHKDLQSQLEQQKFKLSESLERLSRKNQDSVKVIRQQKENVRQTHHDKESALRNQFEQRKEQQSVAFEQQLMDIERSIVRQEHQAKHASATDEEMENGALADKRLELAQRAWQQSSSAKKQAEALYQQSQHKRDEADKALHSARLATRQGKDRLQQLHKQLSPEQDSLRQFLRDNKPGWEHSIGKLIVEPLLERKDLSPQLIQNGDEQHLLGVQIDTSVIDAPPYAQDETALRVALEQATKHVLAAEKEQKHAESELDQRHQEAQLQREMVAERNRAFEQAEQEVSYAQNAKQRYADELKAALEKRRKQAQDALNSLLEEKQKITQQKAQAIAVLKSDFDEQLLEFKSGWQDELAVLDEQIDALEKQVEQKRQQNREQIKQLEDVFNQELANKDIDPNTLKELKQKTERLKTHIQSVSSRREELNEYKAFMQSDWLTQRPVLLEQEGELKATAQQLAQQQSTLQRQYQNKRSELSQALTAVEKRLSACAALITEIEPMVRQLANITFSFKANADSDINLGDQAERISRCTEALESRSRGEKKLKEALTEFEANLGKDAGKDFLDTMLQAFSVLDEDANVRDRLPILQRLLSILASRQRQIVEQGETIGGDLNKFFTVFSDINRKISLQSKRLTDEVSDDLTLDGIARSEVKIISTVDELNFWTPLKRFAQQYDNWNKSDAFLPSESYLDTLADVVEVLPNDANYSIESLLRLELHLNEGGSDLVIKNDRQLLESSSHGMAYLILCKFLLAFTRLLRNQANIDIHWPIDEIGTLAYHNVEKLFAACDTNHIHILGAFPNPESDVLMLFKHRYLIDKQRQRLEKIEPKLSRIAERLQQNSRSNHHSEQSAKDSAKDSVDDSANNDQSQVTA